MIHRSCCDCGTCKPESQFKVKSGGRVWFNRMCHACKLLRCRAANAACKARKREVEQPEPRTYTPPTDFLPMGEPDIAPLIACIGVVCERERMAVAA